MRKHTIYFLVAFFAILYSAYAVLQHNNFGSHAFDLGIFDQAVWHYSRFQWNANSVKGISNILGDHFHPILILLAPLYWIWSNVNMLFIAQGILIALGALPIFWIARDKLKSYFVALTISLCYLIFWGVQSAIAFDFHEIAFFLTAFPFAFYFLTKKRWFWYFFFVIIILLTKENLALVVTALGIYALFQKEWLVGISTMVLGGGWFVAITKFVIPEIVGYPYQYWSLTPLGSDLGGALKTIITKPFYSLQTFFLPIVKTNTMLKIFAPFLGLSILTPAVIILLPTLAERFFSANGLYWTTGFHYSATIAPILAIATIYGMANLYAILKKILRKIDYQKYILTISCSLLIVNCLLLFVPNIPKPLFKLADKNFLIESKETTLGKQIISQIPKDASVTAQENIVPHMTHREIIRQYDGKTYDSEYLIFNPTLSTWPVSKEEYKKSLREILRKDQYGVKLSESNWLVLQKGLKSNQKISSEITNFLK